MSEPIVTTPLRERASNALRDRFLHEALDIATTKFIALRREAFGDFPQGEALRDRARAIKEATLQRLDAHLETLVANVERVGGHVHFATTAEEARRIILDIARRTGARMAVKSKSMATEEIHLNDALEAIGVTPVETDLGEYIIQLAHERPSHIIAPAIHKTKGQVAELFSRELHRPGLAADPEVLTKIAREELREKFLQADLGISGANFAVAETGTVVLVTNEGNGRLTTTWPRVHVALMGIEKVIPRLEDLPVFLKLLARAATGQTLSVYTTLITGPRREGELDGPEEFHLVILDNGRSKILATPFRESLHCIRCGACLNACPVYRRIGGHAYGGVYSGPIGSILTPLYDSVSENPHLPHASSLCGACLSACPVRINIPHMLIGLRELQHEHKGGRGEGLVYGMARRLLERPWLYRLALRLARLGLRPMAKDNWVRKLPGPGHGWT